jgi:hypothetical protein
VLRLLLLLCLLLSPGLAHAGLGCPVPSGASASLGDFESGERLAFIQSRLSEDARRVRLWTEGWVAGYGVLTLGQLALVPLFSPDDRVDLYVGAASSAGGMVALLAVPLDVLADAPALDALIASQPGPGGCAVLAEAERLLAQSARSEALGRSWLMQGANIVYNALAGLVLGLFFNRWASAAFTAATGWLIGEVMILTQPTGAEDALREYREGRLRTAPGTAALDWHVGVAMAPDRLGVGLRMVF